MARSAAAKPAPDTVEGSLRFLAPMAHKPSIQVPVPGAASHITMAESHYEDRPVQIHDARAVADELSLDREGFVLTRRDSAMGDFYDDEAVRSVFYPEVVEQVKELTGASEVLVFDHTIRVRSEENRIERAVREVVRVLHCDFTVKSGPQRVRDLLEPDDAEARLENRVASFNIWRPIKAPVQSWPLVLGDAQSIAPDDLVATDLVYGERTGEVYQVDYNPSQRWYYFPAMEADEVVVLKCYDSMTDGRARFAPHASFDDPNSPPDAAPRESIEVRTLAFFDS